MSSSFLKEPPVVAHPKTLLSIAVSVGGLAVFLIFGSLFLVSQPIGSTVRGYFYNINRFRQFDSVSLPNDTLLYPRLDDNNNSRNTDSLIPWGKEIADFGKLDNGSVNGASEDVNDKSISGDTNENFNSQQGVAISLSSNRTVSKIEETVNQPATPDPTPLQDEKVAKDSLSNDSEVIENAKPPFSHSPDNSTNWTGSVDSGCDLYHGKWVYDSVGPLYTNNSCPVITQMQNCQGNGRPDKEYENWRWKPAECDIPRFDPKKFLELMRGKTLAFIGDSVARNQMESMLCILWQVEVPINRGNKRMQRHYFRSTSTTIVRIWSSWLVQQTSEPFDFAPAGIVKLHLDKPDQGFMEYIPTFDVIVLSSGHWFAKQSVYILNDEIVGGQLWWPDKSRPLKVNNIDAFEISVETIITAMATYPNYTGLTIVRSFSPDHYEGGAWNTGGSCTGKIKPLSDGELVENGFTNIMHEKQVKGFNRGIEKQNNQSKLRLLDITEAFGYRHDGHPGPYRSPDPNKVTKRGPDGRPPPQDCLHWCMPGPVDTWNELVGEIIRREFEGSERI